MTISTTLARLAAAYLATDKGYNLVSLARLLSTSGLSRAELHGAVEQLRRQQVVSAVAIEGRIPPTQAERDAAIREDGQLLGYLSLRDGQGTRLRDLARHD